MSESATILGSVLKNIGNYNKMGTFDDRLILQKTIYLLQSFDLYIGYEFSWYIRGPYCTQLTKDGFTLRESFDEIPKGRFKEKEDQTRLNSFLKFIKGNETNPDWLEIVASIHFLKKVHLTLSKEKILEIVKNKQPYFTKQMCEDAWNYLKKWGMI